MAFTQTCIIASLKWKRRRKKTIMKYNIVTIEREYASGGREIGYRTAEKLGIPYYGKEILEMAAKKKGVSPEYLEELEETPTNSFFYSVYMLSKNLIGDTPSLPENDALLLCHHWPVRLPRPEKTKGCPECFYPQQLGGPCKTGGGDLRRGRGQRRSCAEKV